MFLEGFRMKLLTVKEACERLRISRATLYNLAKQGKIAFVKIGGKSLVREGDIDRLIAEGTGARAERNASTKRGVLGAYWDELINRGLVDPASRVAFFSPRLSDLKPVKSKGKLASQIITDERGER
jgi:excisionase family DNA binding protein